jgi:hypothetical protein
MSIQLRIIKQKKQPHNVSIIKIGISVNTRSLKTIISVKSLDNIGRIF